MALFEHNGRKAFSPEHGYSCHSNASSAVSRTDVPPSTHSPSAYFCTNAEYGSPGWQHNNSGRTVSCNVAASAILSSATVGNTAGAPAYASAVPAAHGVQLSVEKHLPVQQKQDAAHSHGHG